MARNSWGRFHTVPFVEIRREQHGYVYVNDTRVKFEPAENGVLTVTIANWGQPTAEEIEACVKALAEHYRDCHVVADKTDTRAIK